MLKILLFFLLTHLNIGLVPAVNLESELHDALLETYNPKNRPVLNYNDTVTVSFGIEVISLEEFDQVGEKVKFNFRMKYSWYDEYLLWNKSEYQLDFLNIDPKEVWLPDLELYNSANKPDTVIGQGILKVFHTGHMYWIIPLIYDYSCPLALQDFPFDTQDCKMTFGSWKQSKNYLNITTHPLPVRNQLDMQHHQQSSLVLFEPVTFGKFKHNEWNIDDITYKTDDIEYLCCPGELWTISEIDIIMRRNYHKYIVVIIMTFFLTISALAVTSFLYERYTRTFLLVFIPLSIIWLQLYISSKIPVIQHPTRMEKFIQLSYYISMLSAIYSGIIYNISVKYYGYLRNYYPFREYKKFNKIQMERLVYITKNDDAGYLNYYVYSKFGLHLYNIDNTIRLLFVLVYIVVTLYILLNK